MDILYLCGMYQYLGKSCLTGVNSTHQPWYQTVVYFAYWTVLESFNNWNIIKLTNKTTLHEDFEEIYMVVLYGISDNMELLVQAGK